MVCVENFSVSMLLVLHVKTQQVDDYHFSEHSVLYVLVCVLPISSSVLTCLSVLLCWLAYQFVCVDLPISSSVLTCLSVLLCWLAYQFVCVDLPISSSVLTCYQFFCGDLPISSSVLTCISVLLCWLYNSCRSLILH